MDNALIVPSRVRSAASLVERTVAHDDAYLKYGLDTSARR
jgi:hypothetical protein